MCANAALPAEWKWQEEQQRRFGRHLGQKEDKNCTMNQIIALRGAKKGKKKISERLEPRGPEMTPETLVLVPRIELRASNIS